MNQELRDKLNFMGHRFDPAFALQNPEHASSCLPCKNAKTFNNLDEYHKKTFARNVCVTKQQQQPEAMVEPDRAFTMQQTEACKRPCNSKWKDPLDVINRMTKDAGPLSLLTKFLGQRIKLSIRRRKLGPVSSRCEQVSGQLVAFDKHLNLILLDVDRVISIGEEKRHRHSSQIFMRGDSIIYVTSC